ncbi:hypothetical protein ACFQDF_23910 [Ectobacillus funiculus]
MKSGNIEQFQNLSQFVDVQDFNNNIEQWMTDVKEKFSKSELIALKRLIRFCAKVTGVSNAKIGTITAATYKDGHGISRSTFKRMILKAKIFGMLIVHETERKNGSQSSNLYVFQRYELPKAKKLNHPKASNLSKTNNQNNKKRNSDINKQDTLQQSETAHQHVGQAAKRQEHPLDFTYARNDIPKTFINAVLLRSGLAKDINFAWSRITLAYRQSGLHHVYALSKLLQDNAVLNEICQRARSVVRAEKLGEIHKDFGALLYGTMLELFNRIGEDDYNATISEMSGADEEDLFTGASLLLRTGGLLNCVQRIVSRQAWNELNNTTSTAELDVLGVF